MQSSSESSSTAFDLPIELDAFHHVNLRKAYIYALQESDDNVTMNGSLLFRPGAGALLGSANKYPNNLTVLPHMRERPSKYDYIVCAERNLIYESSKKGISANGCVLYCPFVACPECAKAIVQSGVTKVVGHENIMNIIPERWFDRIAIGLDILRQGNVEVVLWKGKCFERKEDFKISFDGKDFYP